MTTLRAVSSLGKEAAANAEVLANLLWRLMPEDHDLGRRDRVFKSLMELAAARSSTLWVHWSDLTRLLGSGSACSEYLAVHTLAALVPHDKAHRFDWVLPACFAHLGVDAISVAGHVAAPAGGIARPRPERASPDAGYG